MLWQKLTPAEQARLLGSALIGGSIFLLAAALIAVALEIRSLQHDLPELLVEVNTGLDKLGPALKDVDAVRKLIPPILAEIKATREVVPSVVAEVAAVRQALPPLIDTSAEAINNASTAVRAVEPHIPGVLTEVKKTREALPGLLDRADQVVARAGQVGQQAGKGAAQGVITGIISAPFQLIGQAGRGLGDAIGLRAQADFTSEDERLASEATRVVVEAGKAGARKAWTNKDSGNRGSAELLAQVARDGQPCMTVRHHIKLKSGTVHERDIDICKQPDGSWTAVKRE